MECLGTLSDCQRWLQDRGCPQQTRARCRSHFWRENIPHMCHSVEMCAYNTHSALVNTRNGIPCPLDWRSCKSNPKGNPHIILRKKKGAILREALQERDFLVKAWVFERLEQREFVQKQNFKRKYFYFSDMILLFQCSCVPVSGGCPLSSGSWTSCPCAQVPPDSVVADVPCHRSDSQVFPASFLIVSQAACKAPWPLLTQVSQGHRLEIKTELQVVSILVFNSDYVGKINTVLEVRLKCCIAMLWEGLYVCVASWGR